jgi:dihydrofolate reductase
MYELIVAMDREGNIGVTDAMGRQRMPWESGATLESGATQESGEVATPKKSKAIKEDMRYFRDKTTNNIIIMGRKTFDSLPKRPLPGRIHIVLTNNTTKYET